MRLERFSNKSAVGKVRERIWKSASQRFAKLLTMNTDEVITNHIREDGRIYTRHFYFKEGQLKNEPLSKKYQKKDKFVPEALVTNYKLFQNVINQGRRNNASAWITYVKDHRKIVKEFLISEKIKTTQNQRVGAISKICSLMKQHNHNVFGPKDLSKFTDKIKNLVKECPTQRGQSKKTLDNFALRTTKAIELLNSRLVWPADAPMTVEKFAELIVNNSSRSSRFLRLTGKIEDLYIEFISKFQWEKKPSVKSIARKSTEVSTKSPRKTSKKSAQKKASSPSRKSAKKSPSKKSAKKSPSKKSIKKSVKKVSKESPQKGKKKSSLDQMKQLEVLIKRNLTSVKKQDKLLSKGGDNDGNEVESAKHHEKREKVLATLRAYKKECDEMARDFTTMMSKKQIDTAVLERSKQIISKFNDMMKLSESVLP